MSVFNNALAQLKKATQYTSLKPSTLEFLKRPERQLQFSLPITMDDGAEKVFDGFRVQYTSARGPYKGGLRYYPQTNLDEVKALAFWRGKFTPAPFFPIQNAKALTSSCLVCGG